MIEAVADGIETTDALIFIGGVGALLGDLTIDSGGNVELTEPKVATSTAEVSAALVGRVETPRRDGIELSKGIGKANGKEEPMGALKACVGRRGQREGFKRRVILAIDAVSEGEVVKVRLTGVGGLFREQVQQPWTNLIDIVAQEGLGESLRRR